jgi:hypothetical protein
MAQLCTHGDVCVDSTPTKVHEIQPAHCMRNHTFRVYTGPAVVQHSYGMAVANLLLDLLRCIKAWDMQFCVKLVTIATSSVGVATINGTRYLQTKSRIAEQKMTLVSLQTS